MQEMKYISDCWYSNKEICAYLGVSRDTLLVWSNEKDMPASEVDEWIKSDKAADNRHTNLRRTGHEC